MSTVVSVPGVMALSDAIGVVGSQSMVVVTEPGRALGAAEVEQVVGAPVVAEVGWDPAVARAVDAGLMASRLPRSLERSLGRVLGALAGERAA